MQDKSKKQTYFHGSDNNIGTHKMSSFIKNNSPSLRNISELTPQCTAKNSIRNKPVILITNFLPREEVIKFPNQLILYIFEYRKFKLRILEMKLNIVLIDNIFKNHLLQMLFKTNGK